MEKAEISPSNGALGDGFGMSVSISGDVVLIGAPMNDDNGSQAGSAYIFRFSPSTGQWLQEQKLLAFGGPSTFFGDSVAVFGDIAVVGESYHSPGSAYVFRFDGTSWNQEQKLVPFDVPATGFGTSVAVSADVILVGADWYFLGSCLPVRSPGRSGVALGRRADAARIRLPFRQALRLVGRA